MLQLLIVTLLSLLDVPTYAEASAPSESLQQVAISTIEELTMAAEKLRNSQTLQLSPGLFLLKQPILIDVANVTVIGDVEGTTITCPLGQNAFVVQAAYVQLQQLVFKDCRESSAVRIKGPILMKSRSKGDGLDDRNRSCFVVVKACVFEDNHISAYRTNSNKHGAAIYATHCDLAIVDSIFLRNAAYGDGGAVHAYHCTVMIHRSLFAQNACGIAGGATCVVYGQLTVHQSIFRENSANVKAGAVEGDSCRMVVEDTVFEGNVAGSGGGALRIYGKPLTLIGAEFSGNTAGTDGGAISAVESGIVVLSSVFRNNDAGNDGGAIHEREGSLIISATKFSNNFAAGDPSTEIIYPPFRLKTSQHV